MVICQPGFRFFARPQGVGCSQDFFGGFPEMGVPLNHLPPGYLLHSHGIDGPFIDDVPSYKPPFILGIFHGYVK
jgi:hypothetical protein